MAQCALNAPDVLESNEEIDQPEQNFAIIIIINFATIILIILPSRKADCAMSPQRLYLLYPHFDYFACHTVSVDYLHLYSCLCFYSFLFVYIFYYCHIYFLYISLSFKV